MRAFEMILIGIAAILSQIGHVASHGRLIQPAQRSSAWRFGFNNPANYDDTQLFCGGFSVQYNSVNKGRCGACGDPYSATVKPNEDADGKYVINGVITGSYVKGDILTAKVDITAYHKGWFEFRLCPLETITTVVTQECLNQNLLTVAGSNSTRVILKNVKKGNGVETFDTDLQLPDGVTCERCVLQWKYNTGNSWGCDSTACGLGRGNQENFVNCADIRISDSTTESSTTKSSSISSQSATMTALTSTTTSQKTSSTSTSTTTAPTDSSTSTTTLLPTSSTTTTSTTSPTTSSTTTTSTSSPTTTSKTTSSTTSTTTTSKTTSSSTTTSLPTPTDSTGKTFLTCTKRLVCRAADGPYSEIPGLAKWCCDNCVLNNCPSSHCSCLTS